MAEKRITIHKISINSGESYLFVPNADYRKYGKETFKGAQHKIIESYTKVPEKFFKEMQSITPEWNG